MQLIALCRPAFTDFYGMAKPCTIVAQSTEANQRSKRRADFIFLHPCNTAFSYSAITYFTTKKYFMVLVLHRCPIIPAANLSTEIIQTGIEDQARNQLKSSPK